MEFQMCPCTKQRIAFTFACIGALVINNKDTSVSKQSSTLKIIRVLMMQHFFTKRTATTKAPKVAKTTSTLTRPSNSNSRPFVELAQVLKDIEAISSRLQITETFKVHLSTLFQDSPDDIVPTVYLASGRIAPEHKGIELGVGDGLLSKAVSESCGLNATAIKSEIQKLGDLALVAESARQTQRTVFQPKPLTIEKVFNALVDIATMDGKSSQKNKIAKICGLLSAGSPIECRYIIRICTGKMRIGLSDQTMLVCLAQASANQSNMKDLKKAEAILKSVFCELPSYEDIIPVLLRVGIRDLPNHCKLSPGIPVKPMLAHPSKSIQALLKRFENKSFTCEYKLDGERAQLHKNDQQSHVFSRNAEDLSLKYPDIQQLCQDIPVDSFILDCEAVAVDQNGHILPFQALQKRKRKDVQLKDIEQPVMVVVFDLLFLNGSSCLNLSLEERRELLMTHFKEIPGKFQFVQYDNCQNVEDIQVFLNKSIEDKCEGLMVKTLVGDESSYEPSKRSLNWFKLKKDYLETAGGDTLDLVVMGAFYGKGKRTGVYGGYLLGIYDAGLDVYQSVCKIGTGFSDEELQRLPKLLTTMDEKHSLYETDVVPDVWIEPEIVFEVQAADFTLSPVHKAGHHIMDKGISLRFPRYLGQREDKKPEDSTSVDQLVMMYESQANLQ